MDTIDNIIKKLDLQPHPEGGYFKETYRSKLTLSKEELPREFEGGRNACTAIYFLLTSDNFSAFHRIKQDEIWHFYSGSPISLHILTKEGNYEKQMIGSNLEKGEIPQFVVHGGDWFASEVESPNSFALAGCTVSPGFDFSDFEMASQESLIKLYPSYQNIISKLTR